jgi:tripartite ATP-independent transporter DctM subunit
MVRLARAVVGRVPGGLSLVVVTSCMFFGGAAGSATAEAAAVGSVLIPAMEKEGYPKPYAAALVAVSAVMGPMIPPSIAMIIYGVLTGTSIASLFLAGVVPGVLIGLLLMVYAYWRARRHGYALTGPISWSERFHAAIAAGPAVMLPLIILGGILSGVFTPTESAAVAVLYALVLSGLVYRDLTLRALYQAQWETALISAGIMIVIAMSNMVAFVFAIGGLAQDIAGAMLAISDNKFVQLLLINILLLVLGTFLELISIMILTLPVLIVIVEALGIDPIHFGIIVVLNVVIGLVTPPVGMCLFITSAISRVSIDRISYAALPMIAICLFVLMLVTYVPEISLFLPSLFSSH